MLPPLKSTSTSAFCTDKGYALGTNILLYIASQLLILSMPTGRFVSERSSSFFSLTLLMLCKKSDNWGLLSCSFLEKENYLLKIMTNLDISTIEVYMARKHSTLIPKERFRPAQQLLLWIKIVHVPECLRCGAGIHFDRKFKFILFYFPSP